MLSFIKLTVGAALLAAVNAQFRVETPASLIACQPAQIVFNGGSGGPYFLSILPAGQASAAAIENLDNAQSSPAVWSPVNLPASTNITIRVTDNQGNNAYSSPIVIQAGSTTDCLASASASASRVQRLPKRSLLHSADINHLSASSPSGSSASTAPSGSASAPASSPTGGAFGNVELSGGVLALGGLFAAAFGILA